MDFAVTLVRSDRSRHWRVALIVVLTAAPATNASAAVQGHGPVYGLSTPTLGRGGWSLDVAGMSRLGDRLGTAMLRPMLSYGVTEDLQLSVSAPLPLRLDADAVPVRGPARMPASRDVELMLGWRLLRDGRGVGTRTETTAWVAIDIPTDQTRGTVETSPALFGSLATGYASRSVYAWIGAAHRRALDAGEGRGDRAGNSTMASLVLGYRPERFREDFPAPDWRAFVELVGEWVGKDRDEGRRLDATGGNQIYLALTALGLYGSWGLAGGPAVPLHNTVHEDFATERVRLALNLSFWF